MAEKTDGQPLRGCETVILGERHMIPKKVSSLLPIYSPRPRTGPASCHGVVTSRPSRLPGSNPVQLSSLLPSSYCLCTVRQVTDP